MSKQKGSINNSIINFTCTHLSKATRLIYLFFHLALSALSFFHELIPLLLALQFFFYLIKFSHFFFLFGLYILHFLFLRRAKIKEPKSDNRIKLFCCFFHSWLYVSENKFLYILFIFLFFHTLGSTKNPTHLHEFHGWTEMKGIVWRFFMLSKKWMFFSLASLNVYSLRLRRLYVVNIYVSLAACQSPLAFNMFNVGSVITHVYVHQR